MSETTLETAASASYAIMVTLTWSNEPTTGDSQTVKRYTNWTEDFTVDAEDFESVTDMEVSLGEIHGGTDDRPGKLTISRQFSPFDVLRSGLLHPRVHIKVEQCDPLDPSNTRRQLFWGHLGRIRSNPGGRASLVTAQLNGIKAELKQVRLGIPATATCAWSFGDSKCGYDKEATKLSGTVLSVGSPQRVSIQLDVGSGVTPNSHYRQGIIRCGGMAFVIRSSYNDGYFDVYNRPPDWIVGLDADLYEGCDKNYSTCQQFGRQGQFMGLGIRIPGRQPLFER
jgi:hypothetical protein